jgi:hypothetical protein
MYDNYAIDCKYDTSKYLYNAVNSFVDSARTLYSIYLYKHDPTGLIVDAT